MIARGQLFIDTDGDRVGQLNGLAVLQLGEYAFGKPSRITATVQAGKGSIVDIEREAKLGGNTHSKGILILKGYLGERFAREKPLSFTAHLTFEQSYSMIDGDSASSAELYALLSALSGVPLRQGLAVTGSVNQRGQIQPIGGVNEKIEGFFRACRERGLTGTQGVLIPRANVENLMLSRDVVEAVESSAFHIYPVSTIEEGIEILTGVAAGVCDDAGVFPAESVFGRVAVRLDAMRPAEETKTNGENEKKPAPDANED
jgi:predicted ATP-dependent protease